MLPQPLYQNDYIIEKLSSIDCVICHPKNDSCFFSCAKLFYENSIYRYIKTFLLQFVIILTILNLSIPYNEGWKIIVNGNVANYFKVHGGFIRIPLNEVISNIEMYFIPMGFKLGMILSTFSMIILFSKLVLHRRNRKQI